METTVTGIEAAEREVARAEVSLAERQAARDERATEAAEIARQRKVNQAELQRLDGLEEVAQKDLVALENARRAARRLEEATASAAAALKAADDQVDAADAVARKSRVTAQRTRIAAQAAGIDSFLETVKAELLARLDAHDNAIREVAALETQVAVARGSGSLASLQGSFNPQSPWAGLDRTDLWRSVAEAAGKAERERRLSASLASMRPPDVARSEAELRQFCGDGVGPAGVVKDRIRGRGTTAYPLTEEG